MKRDGCPTAPLLEARRDGRLSEREGASLDRHLATCPSCAALEEDLTRITTLLRAPGRRVSPLVRQRGRVRLLRAAALGSSPRRVSTGAPVVGPFSAGSPVGGPWRRFRPALLVAFAALAVLALSARLRSPSPSPPLATVSMPPPAPLSSARTATELRPDEGARFTRGVAGGLTVVTLEDGGVTFLVRSQEPEERFLVKTADAEVEVRGTVFRVEAAAARIRAVLVTEGKVLVRFRGTTTLLEAGESWRPPPDPKADETASAKAPAPPLPRPAEARKSAAPPREAIPSAPAPGAAKDFVDGVHMLERGSFSAAAERLSAFSAAHPDDSSAEDAAFLAILALERAGRLAEAGVAARRYLERYPHGYRRAEAEQIAAGAAGAARH